MKTKVLIKVNGGGGGNSLLNQGVANLLKRRLAC